MRTDLTLERQECRNYTGYAMGGALLLAPNVNPEYWAYRVRLTETQAVLGFPKFNTIGIGFAQEEDWNTNLPYTCDAVDIFEHIKHNTGDDSISDVDVMLAIAMVQDAVAEDYPEGLPK